MNTLKDKLIKSEKSEEMLSYILPLYDNDEYVLSIFEALGKEHDLLFDYIDELYNQPFINSSTWTLKHWADLYGIECSPDESQDDMRDKIINFINAKQPINKNRIEVIVSGITDTGVVVEEHFKGYMFHVILVSNDFSVINREIWKRVYDAKPAHLAVRYYVQTDEKLYHYDVSKKTLAPVIKFYNYVGKGNVNDRTINLINNVREGTFTPVRSGEMAGGHKVEPPQSRKRSRDVELNTKTNYGSANLNTSPMNVDNSSSSRETSLSALTYVKNGTSKARICGVHYAGEGVT